MSSPKGSDSAFNFDSMITVMSKLHDQKNSAYEERNKCIALIARMAIGMGLSAGRALHEDGDEVWASDWKNVIFIDLPSGQVSWHIHDSEVHLFKFLPVYGRTWDGHCTREKYRRVLSAEF